LKAKPVKVIDHCFDKLWLASGAIKVFVSENERAAVRLSAFVGRPECAGVTEMQETGWRWREATTIARRLRG